MFDNIGSVVNTDHTDIGMEEVLLSDVVAVLVGGCVDKGGDLLVALLFTSTTNQYLLPGNGLSCMFPQCCVAGG